MWISFGLLKWITYHFANALRLRYRIDTHNSIFWTRIALAMINLYFTSIAFKASNTITPEFWLFITWCSLIRWMSLSTDTIDAWRRKTWIRDCINFTAIAFESFWTETFETLHCSNICSIVLLWNLLNATHKLCSTASQKLIRTWPEIIGILTMTAILTWIAFTCITIIPNLRLFWTIFVDFRFTFYKMTKYTDFLLGRSLTYSKIDFYIGHLIPKIQETFTSQWIW